MTRRRIAIFAALAAVVLIVLIALSVLQMKQRNDSMVETEGASFHKTTTALFR